jgi:hypothetical protein
MYNVPVVTENGAGTLMDVLNRALWVCKSERSIRPLHPRLTDVLESCLVSRREEYSHCTLLTDTYITSHSPPSSAAISLNAATFTARFVDSFQGAASGFKSIRAVISPRNVYIILSAH